MFGEDGVPECQDRAQVDGWLVTDCFYKNCTGYIVNTLQAMEHCGFCFSPCAADMECYNGVCLKSSFTAMPVTMGLVGVALCLAAWRVLSTRLTGAAWPPGLATTRNPVLRIPEPLPKPERPAAETHQLVRRCPKLGKLGVRYGLWGHIKLNHPLLAVFFHLWADDLDPKEQIMFLGALVSFTCWSALLALEVHIEGTRRLCGETHGLPLPLIKFGLSFAASMVVVRAKWVMIKPVVIGVLKKREEDVGTRKQRVAEVLMVAYSVGGLAAWALLLAFLRRRTALHVVDTAFSSVLVGWLFTEFLLTCLLYLFKRAVCGIDWKPGGPAVAEPTSGIRRCRPVRGQGQGRTGPEGWEGAEGKSKRPPPPPPLPVGGPIPAVGGGGGGGVGLQGPPPLLRVTF